MKVHFGGRLFLVAAVLGAAAVFAIAVLVALGGRSVVAGPDAAAPAAAPTPVGHEWSQVEGHGTGTGVWWLGTTANQALELRVNNARALRLEPNATSPNVVGGYNGNSVTGGAYGATISGGGQSGWTNRVTDEYGTIAGGVDNTASGPNATVGGGASSIASGDYATVGGGGSNIASAWMSTVGGGYVNTASGSAATVGGGKGNTAGGGAATVGGGHNNTASADQATVPGGDYNAATGDYSFAAGRRAKANHQGAFVWADSTDADFASTTADQFLVRASGGVSLNVASGGLRVEPNATSPNIVGGYSGNTVTAGVVGATIGGGGESTWTNRVTDDYGTVGGGQNNTASGHAATVGGGEGVSASGGYATVGGGASNSAGGDMATVGGGYGNTASGYAATVAGGKGNTAGGSKASVPGGGNNTAGGDYSFAAGRQAKANNQGCFVWGDSTTADLTCSTNDAFIVRASGGMWFGTTSSPDLTSGFINTSTGGYLTTGGVWTDSSDRDQKENFTPVNGQAVLARLAEVPITTWNHKAEDPSIRHMGPVAQDFYTAFGLGEDERHIAGLDSSGVALAAIQGLYQLAQEQAARIQALEEENASLQQRLDDVEARVTALEGGASTSGAATGPLSGLTAGWLVVGGLVVVGLALVQRRRAGGPR